MSNQTSIEVKIKPNEPVGTPKQMMSLLESYKGSIEPLLPNNIKFEQFKATIRNAMIEIPDIKKCTNMTLIQACITACELGLHVGKARGEGYILPFKNNKKGGIYEATFIPGYKGMLRKAYGIKNEKGQSQVKHIEAVLVYKQDTFSMSRSLTQMGYQTVFDHDPYIPEGKDDAPKFDDIKGGYFIAVLADGTTHFTYLNRKELERIRNSSKVPMSPAYKGWLDEMFKKGILRRGCKTLKVEDASFDAVLDQANNEFSFEDEDKKNDKEKLDAFNKKLLSGIDEPSDAVYEDIEEEEIDVETGEIIEPEPPAEPATQEPETDPLEEEHALNVAAIRKAFDLYLEGKTEIKRGIVTTIIGSPAPGKLEDLPLKWSKKVAQMLNRAHTEFNPSGDTPGKVTDFLEWVCFHRHHEDFKIVRHVIAAASEFRAQSKPVANEPTPTENEPTPAAQEPQSSPVNHNEGLENVETKPFDPELF